MGPRAGLDGGKSRRTGIRSPDRPARSSVAIPTELSGPRLLLLHIVYLCIYLFFLVLLYSDSTVGCTSEQSCLDLRQSKIFSLFSQPSRRSLGPNHPRLRWILGDLPTAIN